MRDRATSSTIAVFRFETELTSTGGRLVELRPQRLLDPEHEYELLLADDIAAVVFTSSITDNMAPLPPQFGVATLGHCKNMAGNIRAAFEVRLVDQAGEPAILLVERTSWGTVYELGTDHLSIQENAAVEIDSGSSVSFQVIAMDLARNRSSPTDPSTFMAGPIPEGDTHYSSDDRADDVEERAGGGCVCQTGTAGTSLVLSLGALFIARRRRAGAC